MEYAPFSALSRMKLCAQQLAVPAGQHLQAMIINGYIDRLSLPRPYGWNRAKQKE
jgi:hypothetical protein